MSASVQCIKEAKKAGLHCIVGTTLSIKERNGSIVLLAHNLEGWKSLIKIISAANTKNNYVDHPEISLSELESMKLSGKGLYCIIGGVNSIISSRLFKDNSIVDVLKSDSIENAKLHIHKDWIVDCESLFDHLECIFGKDQLLLESCIEVIPADQLCNQAVRYLGKKLSIPVVPTVGSHYINRDDWKDHHILLCSGLKITLKNIQAKLAEDENLSLQRFIRSSDYFVRPLEDIFPTNEIENLKALEAKFEDYSVFSDPQLPKFECPNGKDTTEYTKELCREGWKLRKPKLLKDKTEEYKSRVEYELKTYSDIGILDYFLIVADFLKAARARGEYTGIGRGSAGGCSIAYFLGITEVDPVKYELSSSRFYNAGRNTQGKKTYPDIDWDLMVEKREDSILYLKQKYGPDRIGQVITMGRLQGRGALREVLRINDACSFDEINKITEYIPDEAKIAGELQEMEEAGEEKSIIMWALKNNAKHLKPWCYLDDQDKCQGEYSRLFEQAIRLEGTLKSQGRHAAAIILGAEKLSSLCPMVFNKSKEDPLCGFEYQSLEAMGLVKFDLLGVSVLDKLMNITKLVKERHG